MLPHFVSACCGGEKCSVCGEPATHKLGEEIPPDDPSCIWSPLIGPHRHNLTAYVCCRHFTQVLGPATGCQVAS